MIILKYASLRSDSFKTSFTKLTNADKLDVKTTYNIMRLANLLEGHVKTSQKEWIKLLTKYVQTDGMQWKLNEDKSDFAYLDGIDAETAKAAVNEFLAKTVEIDRHKLDLNLLEGAGLSANDLAILTDIISIPEEV